MLKDGLICIIRRIADNTRNKRLEHKQITALAHAALQILDDIEGISLRRDEIEILLKMLTTRAPHHARSSIAGQALSYLNECAFDPHHEESKKQQGQENF